MTDKYLLELMNLKDDKKEYNSPKDSKYKELKKQYKLAGKKSEWIRETEAKIILYPKDEYEHEKSKEDLENRAYVTGLANELMKKGQREGNTNYAILGAELYEKLEKGNRDSVKRRLLQAISKDPNRKHSYYVSEAEKFLKRNPSEERLENKVLATASAISLGIGLFFLAPNLTGEVIANLSTQTSNYVGAILLTLGTVGFFTYSKTK